MEASPVTRHPLAWLPNAITVARLVALPVLVWLIIRAEGPTDAVVAWTFAAIGATDFIDGKLARAFKAESKFGRVADPFADRMLMAVGLIGLIALDRFAWPGPIIILVRDIAAIAAFVLLARRGVVLHVDMAGKISSTVAMFAVGLGLLLDQAWVTWFFWFAVALSVATFANYARSVPEKLRISSST